ncbi:hypothetical protein AB0J21_06670 [Streptomyces sp. NPDC049954]|uniref:hypothetical protein n=1 Tax=Streptomyces sp. NPDC049954 TaxID=3155779 RepID=UPI00343EEDDD
MSGYRRGRAPGGRRGWGGVLSSGVLGLLAVPVLAGCTAGPGGVELGTDWKGARSFVLSKVGGELTVVGVNPDRGTAEPLVVVPAQADDDDTLAPQIVRLADGRWMIAVPRSGGKPDRLYRLDRADRAVAAQGASLAAVHGLFPGRSRVAVVPGLPDGGGQGETEGGGDGKGRGSTILVEKPVDWATERTVRLPGTIALAASDPASDWLCVTRDTGDDGGRAPVATVDLVDGRVRETSPVPEGFQVQQLACADGVPVLAGSSTGTSTGPGTLRAERRGGALVVEADGGRVDQLAVDRDGSVAVAVFHQGREYLVLLDADSGKETSRLRLPGLTDADGLRRTGAGWLVVSQEGAVAVDPARRATREIALPGELLAS